MPNHLKLKFRQVNGIVKLYMQRFGFVGWASFWNVVYILPGHEDDRRLLLHEMTHMEQIQKDGRLLFSIKYLWWLLRYGYWNNPYEVEARNQSEQLM